MPSRWWRRRGRERTEEDFQTEIEAHLAIETDRLIAEGMTPAEAHHAARRAFGNVAATSERFHESRRVVWLDELRQDVRYAWRTLRRSPGFTAVAVLTLTIGVGANTAIFSVVNAVLLRPLPYREPGSLVLIEPGEIGLSPQWAMSAWRDRARTLSSMAGFNGPRPATLITDRTPEQVHVTDVTWNLLSFLGVAPSIGRDFVEADAAAGATAVAIVSDELWRRQLGGDATAIGRTVTVSGTPLTIIGVRSEERRVGKRGDVGG